MLKLPTLTPEFWTARVMQAVSVILGIAATFGLNLTAPEKAGLLAVTVAFVPGLIEMGWLHFRGMVQSILPAPTHVIVATSTSGHTAVQAENTPATVTANVGSGESVTVTHSGSSAAAG
jgi:hypothetical protein